MPRAVRTYKLIFVLPNGASEVCGSEADIRDILMDWHESPKDGSMLIRGEMDNHDRDPITHAVLREAIIEMSMVPLG